MEIDSPILLPIDTSIRLIRSVVKVAGRQGTTFNASLVARERARAREREALRDTAPSAARFSFCSSIPARIRAVPALARYGDSPCVAKLRTRVHLGCTR